ncbi:hypothetical protein C5C71_01820 [Rathayibacter sp. AY1C1]|uniref:hypothetical protein n=1 Tax=Rathayibacter sp. AY1C1 TaxID=2080534 RepID=UPI000CE89EE1|nr:hypothetical protein [Rathayibacter sp. AY1C1]PPH13311.1 hypothetical protein C5C71_01820 [Rathayibacter sp. AY1C1]
MITFAVVALLRLIPYLFAAVNAWTKGYRWLTAATTLISILVVWNFVAPLSPEWSGLTSSIFALLLMFHALDLKPKEPRS